MVKRLFKWLIYAVVLIVVLVIGVLATAYLNRDKLLDKLSAELSKGINGKFYIDKIDFTFLHHFPNFSITLRDVHLRDQQYEVYRREIFVAKRIFVDVGLYPLLKKEIVVNSVFVDDADIFVFRTHNGDTNTDIFKRPVDSTRIPTPAETSMLFKIEQIGFNDVAVMYSDSVRNKVISFEFLNTEHSLVQTDSGYNISIEGDMHFNKLLLNPQAGSFLEDKNVDVSLFLHFNPKEKYLDVLPSSLFYQQNQINLAGNFELRKAGKYTLEFKATDINPEETKKLLSPKLNKSLAKFKFDQVLTVEVDLTGKSLPAYIPKAVVNFHTSNADFHYGSLDFYSLTLKGSFTNEVDSSEARDNKNSRVIIDHFKGKMEKFPLAGKVTFTELHDPVMNLQFTSKHSYKEVNDHLDNDRFVLDKGNFTTEISYVGKVSEYLDPTRTRYKGKLNGSIRAVDASLRYKPKKIHLDQIQLACRFNEKVFTINELNLNANGSSVKINGMMQDFIPFFIRPQKKAIVTLNVESPKFDLTSFASPRGIEKKTKQQNKKDRKKMTDLLDLVYDRLEFDVDVSVEELTFRKFNASHFKGDVRLNNQVLRANPISMEVAGGTMELNFSLKNVFDPVAPMSAEARISNANIRELFLNFNNFNQKTILAENLRGTISADVTFSANVNENYNLLAPSMRGSLDCKISNGGLMNFEPMENMSNFLFKKRDFSDVEFAELNSNFSIDGTNMDISRMEIQSTVLSLFLEGRYSFTDSTSLSVQIPLSNLKKRHKDFKPKNIGTHSKAGPSVFLHVYRDRDINSKIKIDYDPFKKWAGN